MRDDLDARGLIHITGPVVFAILVLATEPLWDDWVAGPAPDRFWPLMALSILAVVASLYAPIGRRTLITSSPSIGPPPRSNTAIGSPSAPHTTFMHQ